MSATAAEAAEVAAAIAVGASTAVEDARIAVDTEAAEVTPARKTLASPLADFHLRDADPAVCPFFRSMTPDGSLAAPIGRPDDANRCAAFGEPLPQSARQQELVCRTDAHTSCPRYLRGSAAEADDVPLRPSRTMTTAILSSILLLVAAMAAAIAFVLARGGLELPGPAPTDVAAQPSPTIISLPTATPPQATPTPSLAATPVPTPAPTATPVPSPTSDRYALLEPCPDKPDCWIYTVRSGDNLTSIANYFGIPLSVVYDLNPELRTQSLRPGKKLILPPPTR